MKKLLIIILILSSKVDAYTVVHGVSSDCTNHCISTSKDKVSTKEEIETKCKKSCADDCKPSCIAMYDIDMVSTDEEIAAKCDTLCAQKYN